ncbi:MAG: NUDIX domain-containing protein [Clostridia bacterium]|nr:NUDIX domain-containing protein [Clostridia bacterium]
MDWEKSCGAVVFTRKGGEIRFVIVQEMAGAYSFPKGHMEGNETEAETARREVFEEIGLLPVFLDGFREADEYDLQEKPGTRKRVVYFLAEYKDEPLTPRAGEIRGIQLLTYDQALGLFPHEGTKRVLTAAYEYIREKAKAWSM